MFCRECGTEASDGARYCSSCGKLLGAGRDAEPRAVASGGEPWLSWAGRGPTQVGAVTPVSGATPELAELELATFARRMGAFGIDLAMAVGVGFVLMMITSVIYLSVTGIPEDNSLTDAQKEAVATIWWSLFIPTWFATTWLFNSKGWSLGKRAVGLRIVGGDGRPPGVGRGIGRTFGTSLSYLGLGIGFMWAAWDKHGQTWQDKMTGTYVVRVDSVWEHHERRAGRGSLH